MIFRFDDICGNTDLEKVYNIVTLIKDKFSNCAICFCISLLYHKLDNERVFPAIYKALSDYREFYGVDFMKFPPVFRPLLWKIKIISHGLLHIDHRLLNYQAQEMSILTAASLLKSNIFVPPFNKWNEDTETICKENDIELVKFEDGWLSAEHNNFKTDHRLWYLHSRLWTVDKFKEWLK